MKTSQLSLIFLLTMCYPSYSQPDTVNLYKIKTYMITMRDGVKLFTVVMTPKFQTQPLPFLIRRTPYGAGTLFRDSVVHSSDFGARSSLAKGGYIFVYQDIRGKFQSEGKAFTRLSLPHRTQKNAIDESTDAYDAIDWLVKNIPGNNGKAGISGISYPGWLALVASVDAHPALKASSPQASPGDLFLGDDFFHNGAFRLSYGVEMTYAMGLNNNFNPFPAPRYDLFDWYLALGPLSNVNEKVFHNNFPRWNYFVDHPVYDAIQKEESPYYYMQKAELPMLHVGGYYDQEDLAGPQTTYRHLEKQDRTNKNFLILGPWNHGQWGQIDADSLGKISFETNTAGWFSDIQKKWFDYWLKGIGDGNFAEAYCFQTGTNQWKSYPSWPPKTSTSKKLYATPDNRCSFNAPKELKGEVNYISDPAKPIPYRTQPIEATYSQGSRWNEWHVEDQRFVSSRPDVVNFIGDTLTENFTVTGDITVHLFASTTGTDADFVVKLIDVYPDIDRRNVSMSGYQLPVAMEVFRGRFRKSFEKAEAITPNKPEEYVIDLHQINHTFLKGHRLMIQVQSSWFPVIDRNPQKFVPNIFKATENDFIRATHTIYCNSRYATYIDLPVANE